MARSRLCKALCTGLASVSLMFCVYVNAKSEVSKPYIHPQEAVASNGQTIMLAERVLQLSSFLFPSFCDTYKGAIYIGKDEGGINRYAVISGWKENEWRSKTLDINIYCGSDSEVGEDLLNEDYNSVAKALGKSSLRMVGFYDLNANGLTTDFGDFLVIRDKKDSKSTVERPTWLPNNVLGEVNDAYRSVLEMIAPVLEKERCKILEQEKISTRVAKKQIEAVRKVEKVKLSDRKREDDIAKQRIETLLQNLNQLVGHEL